MEGMPLKLPKYVTLSKTKYGKVLFYFRRDKGPRTRLPDDPRSNEFEEAYNACLIGQPIKAKVDKQNVKSLRWLVTRYMESAAWSSLSPATRRQRSNIFKLMTAHDGKIDKGSVDYQRITSAHVRKGLELRKDKPAQANNHLKALMGLFDWAVANNHLATNPAKDVERLKVKTVGFPAWTEEDAAAFRAKWPIGTTQRLAFELLAHTGLRRSDVVRLGRQHIRGNVLTITTQKTGSTVTIELSQYLLDIIEKTKTGDLHLLVTSFGKPFTKEGFGNWFHEHSSKAKVFKNAHGVRKLAATMAANAGATTHELMAQFGWATTQQAEVYTKGADRVRLGIKSSRKVAGQIGGKTLGDD